MDIVTYSVLYASWHNVYVTPLIVSNTCLTTYDYLFANEQIENV